MAEGLLPWRSFHGRIIAAIEQIMRTEGRGKTLLVSTSGGVIGTIVAHVLGLANHIGIELNWAAQRVDHAADLQRRQDVAVDVQRPAASRPGRPAATHHVSLISTSRERACAARPPGSSSEGPSWCRMPLSRP